MAADSLVVITVEGSNDRFAVYAAYHRSMPEVRGEADCPGSALDRLAERLVLDLDCVSDDFHRDLMRRALVDRRPDPVGPLRGRSRAVRGISI